MRDIEDIILSDPESLSTDDVERLQTEAAKVKQAKIIMKSNVISIHIIRKLAALFKTKGD